LERHEIRAEDLSWRDVEDEVVILDLRSSRYLSLNGTGALLWQALDAGADDAALVDLLVDRFGVPAGAAAADVAAFLDHCVGLGVLKRVEADRS